MDHLQGEPDDEAGIGRRTLNDRSELERRAAGHTGGGNPLFEVVGHSELGTSGLGRLALVRFRAGGQISDVQALQRVASTAFASLQAGQVFVGSGTGSLIRALAIRYTTSATITKTITELMNSP